MTGLFPFPAVEDSGGDTSDTLALKFLISSQSRSFALNSTQPSGLSRYCLPANSLSAEGWMGLPDKRGLQPEISPIKSLSPTQES